LIQVADLFCPRTGEAVVVPVDSTVVVAGVTALIVVAPTPVCIKVMVDPIAYGTLALVGNLNVLAEALLIVTIAPASAATVTYAVVV
jgi:hypothetical protein